MQRRGRCGDDDCCWCGANTAATTSVSSSPCSWTLLHLRLLEADPRILCRLKRSPLIDDANCCCLVTSTVGRRGPSRVRVQLSRPTWRPVLVIQRLLPDNDQIRGCFDHFSKVDYNGRPASTACSNARSAYGVHAVSLDVELSFKEFKFL